MPFSLENMTRGHKKDLDATADMPEEWATSGEDAARETRDMEISATARKILENHGGDFFAAMRAMQALVDENYRHADRALRVISEIDYLRTLPAGVALGSR